MPEGPEIWRTAKTLSQALSGKEITDIFFAFDELSKHSDRLIDSKVTNVEARGKAILTHFETEEVLYSHNQLYGKWFIKENGEEPDTNRKLRVAIHNDKHAAYLYSASEIELLPVSGLSEHSYLRKLGPDLLHPETTFEAILDQYHDDSFQNRKLATLLLDQAFLAGVGNYLRAEIMFYAKVDPSVKLKSCSDEQKRMLAEASQLMARRSFETKGITNDLEIVEALKRENAERSEYRHFVYKRTGGRCHKCGTVIEEDKTGGRKIYYCPNCQNIE